MAYFVVNTLGSRDTHVMKSGGPWVPGLINQIVTGAVKGTLCGLTAARYVNVFSPWEASCAECRRRWELDVRAEAQWRATTTPQQRAHERNVLTGLRVAMLMIVFIVAMIIVFVYHRHG